MKYLTTFVVTFIMFFLIVGAMYSAAGVNINMEILAYQSLGMSVSLTLLRWCCK